MRFALASFVTLGSAALAAAQPARRALNLNPVGIALQPIPDVPAAVGGEPLTNAKRFANGLPPAKPKAHRRVSHGVAPRGGSRVGSAPRAATSPLPPTSTKCNILVRSATETFGYLSPVWNGFGEYGQFQSEQAGALEVSFSYTSDSASQLEFVATNAPSAAYTIFGAVSGFASTSDDFGPGSYNYAYIAGTTQTPAGSPPFDIGDSSFSAATGIPETIESAIWSYDSKTQAITAQWINTDGSAPASHFVYANDSNQALLITGDVKTLQDTFGSPYPEVTFTCVPPAPVVTPA